MENSVFISYSHRDANMVKFIVDHLNGIDGIEVWFDDKLRAGEQYFSVIANQIIECKYFLFMVSAYSISSDWCLRELEFAASEQRRIVAIWLDEIEIPPRVRLVIQNTHYIKYYSESEESFKKMVAKVFLDGVMPQNASSETNGHQEAFKNGEIFLEKEKVKKIEKLLLQEKQKKYSICFKPENAWLLGAAYEQGIGVSIDKKTASLYYKISAYKNNYDGKYFYAALHRKTAETDEQKESFFSQMVDAADHDSVYALTYLGDDYYYGRNGCDTDRNKAYLMWTKAASLGGVQAMYYLAYGYRWGECVPKDYELCYMYALLAAECGFPRAFRLIGFMYQYGELYEKNTDKAMEMFDQAIIEGDHLSLCYKGDILYKRKEYAACFELYEQACRYADGGDITSGLPYYNLGVMYEYGRGVEIDLIRAVKLYFKGAERKHKKTLKHTVDTIMKISDESIKDQLLLRSLELGCAGAAITLGDRAQKKSSGNKLSAEAEKYYTLGAESGDLNCVLRLLNRYPIVIGSQEDENHALAIKWFQFLFANIDEEFLKSRRSNNTLTTYYYAYAIELGFEPVPDRQFVKMYLKKSLEECPVHLQRIVTFAVDGFLFPETSGSEFAKEITHAIEILDMAEDYLEVYRKYITDNYEYSDYVRKWRDLRDCFQKGYLKVSEEYKKGVSVPKDKSRAKDFQLHADLLVEWMQDLAVQYP